MTAAACPSGFELFRFERSLSAGDRCLCVQKTYLQFESDAAGGCRLLFHVSTGVCWMIVDTITIEALAVRASWKLRSFLLLRTSAAACRS